MDFPSLATGMTSLGLIKQALAAAIEIRDFNKAATEIAKLNDALLDTQNAVIAQNSTLFALQQEKFEAAEELRKLKEALAEKSRYSLFEIFPRMFAYRVNLPPAESRAGEPITSQPLHYLCQGCFDKGIKMVLQASGSGWICNGCKAGLYPPSGERVMFFGGHSDFHDY